MKKGCVITLIVLAVIVFIGYLGARYVFTHFFGFIAAMEQMEQLVKENTKRLNEQFPFDTPETPSLSETQMNAYLNVLRPMHEITQNNDFQTFSEEIKAREKADEKPTFSDMTEFFQNMADTTKDTYTQYFRLLEEQQLSPDEYNYIEKCVLTALTIESYGDRLKDKVSDEFAMDLRDRMRMEKQMKSDRHRFKVQMEEMDPEAYDKIVQIITPHLEELDTLKETFNFHVMNHLFDEEDSEDIPEEENSQEGQV